MAAAIGLDILVPGTSRKAVEMAIASMRPAAAPIAARAGITGGSLVGPAALASGLITTGYAAQEQARRDAEMYGEPRIPLSFLYNPILGDMPTIGLNPLSGEPIVKKTRKASKFNKAISAGMKSVRSSKFMGKKGTISNSKKAFATVTKTVSSLKKGRKRPTKGVRGTIARAVRRYI